MSETNQKEFNGAILISENKDYSAYSPGDVTHPLQPIAVSPSSENIANSLGKAARWIEVIDEKADKADNLSASSGIDIYGDGSTGNPKKITNTGVNSVENTTAADTSATNGDIRIVNKTVNPSTGVVSDSVSYVKPKGINDPAFKALDSSTSGLTSDDNHVPTSKTVQDAIDTAILSLEENTPSMSVSNSKILTTSKGYCYLTDWTKNLLNVNLDLCKKMNSDRTWDSNSTTYRGVTYTVDDATHSITFDGTSSSSSTSRIYLSPVFETTKYSDYWAVGVNTSDTAVGFGFTYCQNPDGSTWLKDEIDQGVGTKVNTAYPYFRLTIKVEKGHTADNLSVQPMFMEGTTPHAYVPYDGYTVTSSNSEGTETDSVFVGTETPSPVMLKTYDSSTLITSSGEIEVVIPNNTQAEAIINKDVNLANDSYNTNTKSDNIVRLVENKDGYAYITSTVGDVIKSVGKNLVNPEDYDYTLTHFSVTSDSDGYCTITSDGTPWVGNGYISGRVVIPITKTGTLYFVCEHISGYAYRNDSADPYVVPHQTVFFDKDGNAINSASYNSLSIPAEIGKTLIAIQITEDLVQSNVAYFRLAIWFNGTTNTWTVDNYKFRVACYLDDSTVTADTSYQPYKESIETCDANGHCYIMTYEDGSVYSLNDYPTKTITVDYPESDFAVRFNESEKATDGIDKSDVNYIEMKSGQRVYADTEEPYGNIEVGSIGVGFDSGLREFGDGATKAATSFPVTFGSNGTPIAEYTIYGNTGGVGDRTANYVDRMNLDAVELYPNQTTGTVEAASGSSYSIIIPVSSLTDCFFSINRETTAWNRCRLAGYTTYPEVGTAATFVDNTTGTATDDTSGNYYYNSAEQIPAGTNYIMVFLASGMSSISSVDIFREGIKASKPMLTSGTEKLPYVKYYSIPVTCNSVTSEISVDAPLAADETVTYEDSGSPIYTVDGQNTMTFGSTVAPSKVKFTYVGWRPSEEVSELTQLESEDRSNMLLLEKMNGAKNYIDSKIKSQTITTGGANITVTVNPDKSFEISGTTGSSDIFITICEETDFVLPVGDYVLSGLLSGAGSGLYLYMAQGSSYVHITNGTYPIAEFSINSNQAYTVAIHLEPNKSYSTPQKIYPMISDKSAWDSGLTQYMPYALPNSILTQALVEQVDEGGKNLLDEWNEILKNLSTSGNSVTVHGITYTNTNGTITMSGTANNPSDSAAYLFLLIDTMKISNGSYVVSWRSKSVSNAQICVKYLNMSETIQSTDSFIELPSNRTDSASMWISIPNGTTVSGSIDIMICTLADWNVSHKYTPYALPNSELTKEVNILRTSMDNLFRTPVFGFRINKNESASNTAVEYLYDAVGMTPAGMDFTNSTFNYGSWGDAWFVKNNKPVALNFDGTEAFELDPTNWWKKSDGTTDSGIEDATGNYNFMSRIPLVYVNRWEDENYNYVAVSERPVTPNFLAQAHTGLNGTINSNIYLPMFKGWIDGSTGGSISSTGKLRSLAGKWPSCGTTYAEEARAAKNITGSDTSGWQLIAHSQYCLMNDLLTLISKSIDVKGSFGRGDISTYSGSDSTVRDGSVTGYPNNGKYISGYEGYASGTNTKSTCGQFFGYDDATHHVTTFFVQDLWGNRWDRSPGLHRINRAYRVKMTPPYSETVNSSYITAGIQTPSSEGWLRKISSSNTYGHLPFAVGDGAADTKNKYFWSYFYTNSATDEKLSLVGGDCVNGGRCSSRFVHLNLASSNRSWSIGGSPCYVSP